jgi:hypothetical protein
MSYDRPPQLIQLDEPGPDCPRFSALLPVLDYDDGTLDRSPELTPTWTSQVWCLVPASPRVVSPGPSGTGPALPSPQALCLSEELPARCAPCSSIPATVRSPLPTTGLVFVHRQGNGCTIAAKLRVQHVPYTEDDPPECCQLFITPTDAGQARAHLANCAYCRTQRVAYCHLDAGRRRHFGAALAMPYSIEEMMSTMLDDSGTTGTPGSRPPSSVAPTRPRRPRVFSSLAALAAILILSLLAAVVFISHPRVAHISTQQPFAVPNGASLTLSGVSMVSSNEG